MQKELLIIRTENGEYKNMMSNRGKIWLDHKYQLVAYALLIDEVFDTCVKRGFINYIPEKMIRELKITYSMKVYVKRVLGAIKRIIREEKLPQRKVSKRKCGVGAASASYATNKHYPYCNSLFFFRVIETWDLEDEDFKDECWDGCVVNLLAVFSSFLESLKRWLGRRGAQPLLRLAVFSSFLESLKRSHFCF